MLEQMATASMAAVESARVACQQRTQRARQRSLGRPDQQVTVVGQQRPDIHNQASV